MARKPTLDAGTPLADYRYDFPLEKLGEKKRRAAKCRLTASGYFLIDYPPEVVKMFGMAAKDATAYGMTLGEAQATFDRKIGQYKNAIQTEKREKVIVVKFLYNTPGGSPLESVNSLCRADHGKWNDGAGRHALALDYEVMYRIGNALWDVPINDDGSVTNAPHYRHRYPMEDRAYQVLDWTEEREEFLSRMTLTLDDLVHRLKHFFRGDLLANMTRAIEQGGGLAALPAPERKR
jgi:hypothetical protein